MWWVLWPLCTHCTLGGGTVRSSPHGIVTFMVPLSAKTSRMFTSSAPRKEKTWTKGFQFYFLFITHNKILKGHLITETNFTRSWLFFQKTTGRENWSSILGVGYIYVRNFLQNLWYLELKLFCAISLLCFKQVFFNTSVKTFYLPSISRQNTVNNNRPKNIIILHLVPRKKNLKALILNYNRFVIFSLWLHHIIIYLKHERWII